MRTDIKKNTKTDTGAEIAIIGVSLRFPKSNSPDELWDHLLSQRSLISEVPPERWDKRRFYGDPRSEANKTGSVHGGFIEDADCFDAAFFNISPREAMFMDPQQRIVMELAWKAIEDAGCNAGLLKGSKTGVFMGVCNTDYTELIEKEAPEIDPYIPTGTSGAIISNRISYWFDFKGPSITIDTACAGSLIAMHQAVRSLENGECDMALAGGVNLCWTPRRFIALSRGGMLSAAGRCRSFDASADGYVRAEGGAILLLKPLKAAMKEEDPIHAVIRGIGTNHGGRTNSLTITNPQAHAELIAEVYEKAGVSPDTVSYIETHGPGTPLGDPIEIYGLKLAFKQLAHKFGKKLKAKSCGLGSVKTNLGHLEAAAGIAGVVKVLMALKHEIIPASIHFTSLNPAINFTDSPFYMITESQPWRTRMTKNHRMVVPRRAGVSSFGFGGSNAHVIIEEYIAPRRPGPQSGVAETPEERVFIPLSAKNAARLREYASAMLDYLNNRYGRETASTAAREGTNLERRIAALLADILQVDERNFQLQLEFGEYGVEPVHLAQLAERLPTELQIAAPTAEFMRLNSIRAIASYLSSTAQPEESADAPDDGRRIQRRDLLNIAYTLQVGRVAMEERVVFLTRSIPELRRQLAALAQGDAAIPDCWRGRVKPDENADIAGGEEDPVLTLLAQNEYEKIAQLWVTGSAMDWDLLYGTAKPRRISLPSYPFARERYWIPQSRPEAEALGIFAPATADKPKGIELRQLADVAESLARLDGHPKLHAVNVPQALPAETLQTELALSLADVLFIRRESVNVDQKFVDLGLDSIVAVEWVRAINKRYGAAIPATKVYDYPCIREFAEFLAGQSPPESEEAPVTAAAAAPGAIAKPHGLILRALPSSAVKTETGLKAPILATGLKPPLSPGKMPDPTSTEPAGVSIPELEFLQNALADSLAEALFCKRTDLDFEKKFIDLGLDSIVAVEWVRKINKQYGTAIAATKVYDYPNIRELAVLLNGKLRELRGGAPRTAQQAVASLTVDELLLKVYQGTLDVDSAERCLYKMNEITEPEFASQCKTGVLTHKKPDAN